MPQNKEGMKIFQTTLKEHPEFFHSTVKLIEFSLSYSSNHSFKTDFYLLMNPSNFPNGHILVEKKSQKVIGHLGTCLRTLSISSSKSNSNSNGHHTPVALLGGISIHPKYRGQGLLKKLMTKALAKHEDYVAFFMLWSDLEGLYQKFCFFQTGRQVQTGLKSCLNSLEKGSDGNGEYFKEFERKNFPSLSGKEFDQVKDLYNKDFSRRYTTFLRDKHTWSLIKEISSTDIFIKKDKCKNVISYFCLGKGQDLKDIIHEFACHPKYRNETIQTLYPLKFWPPQKEYKKTIKKNHLAQSGLLRLGNPSLFKDFVFHWSQGQITLKRFSHEYRDISFTFLGKEYNRVQEQFVFSLFGYPPPKEFEDWGLEHPLYISGLDSI